MFHNINILALLNTPVNSPGLEILNYDEVAQKMVFSFLESKKLKHSIDEGEYFSQLRAKDETLNSKQIWGLSNYITDPKHNKNVANAIADMLVSLPITGDNYAKLKDFKSDIADFCLAYAGYKNNQFSNQNVIYVEPYERSELRRQDLYKTGTKLGAEIVNATNYKMASDFMALAMSATFNAQQFLNMKSYHETIVKENETYIFTKLIPQEFRSQKPHLIMDKFNVLYDAVKGIVDDHNTRMGGFGFASLEGISDIKTIKMPSKKELASAYKDFFNNTGEGIPHAYNNSDIDIIKHAEPEKYIHNMCHFMKFAFVKNEKPTSQESQLFSQVDFAIAYTSYRIPYSQTSDEFLHAGVVEKYSAALELNKNRNAFQQTCRNTVSSINASILSLDKEK